MSKDEKPRTAFEIAMERLQRRDAEEGVVSEQPTESQKAAIAEARNVLQAKLAEVEILHRAKIATVFDPAERQRLEAEYRDELRRLQEDCDRKIGKIRQAP